MKTAFDVFFIFAMFVLVPAAVLLRPWYEQAVEKAHPGVVYPVTIQSSTVDIPVVVHPVEERTNP